MRGVEGLPQDFRYTDDELDLEIEKARNRFTDRFMHQTPAEYGAVFNDARRQVGAVLAQTEDLVRLDPAALAAQPSIVAALRYTTAPPVSEEDLKTLAGWPFKPTPNTPRVRQSAPKVAAALAHLVDGNRFPWLAAARAPTSAERQAAIDSTATLLAIERFRTARRRSASSDQEQVVRRVLEEECHLRKVPVPPRKPGGHITLISDLEPGTFTTECVLHGAKCDVPTRLPDGLLLPIECKVSNGQKNGWKRVGREVQGKAEAWGRVFGSAAVVIGVMLDGNFDKGTLRAFQDHGYFIFWQHDLDRLAQFVTLHTP